MQVFLVKGPVSQWGVIAAENRADAALQYDAVWLGSDKQNDLIRDECDDSINNYCERLLTEYEVTELYRAEVLEWVERRLDGDKTITIIL